MSNRRKVKGGGRVSPRAVRPQGATHGVEIDVKDNMVYVTVHCGEAVFTVGWLVQDAEQVNGMLTDAVRQIRQDVTTSPTIVRESGIVVAHTLPPT